MKVAIVGSRGITSMALVERAVKESGFDIDVVISGGARGVDTLAIEWAKMYGVAYEEYPADWDKYGKSAGYKRNAVMVNMAEGVIAIWDGKSRGTKHSIDLAIEKDKSLYVLALA